MAHSKIMQKIEDLSEEREKLVAREGSHHAGADDHRRLDEIDHTLSVLWDLRRRELAGENVRLDEDFLDRYVVSPGEDSPDGYRWRRPQPDARARAGYNTEEVRRVEGENFLGLEVRANDGTDLGRVTDVITDRATGEVTHLVLERGGVDAEVSLSAVAIDEDGEFATYSPDASDVEPGDHASDEYKPGGYSPVWEAIPDQEDYGRQGQFVHVGDLDEPPVSPAQEAREDWEDESYEPDSGYPENETFVDEQTGEETNAYRDGGDLRADVAEVLDSTEVHDDTGIQLRRIVGTVVVLGGAAASREDLDGVVAEILHLDGVADVDTTDVDVR
jgi:sporulation protein YlmC with PRC-barrel domain